MCLLAAAWTAMVFTLLGSSRVHSVQQADLPGSALIDVDLALRNIWGGGNIGWDRGGDFGEQMRMEKLENKNLVREVQKQNEEILRDSEESNDTHQDNVDSDQEGQHRDENDLQGKNRMKQIERQSKVKKPIEDTVNKVKKDSNKLSEKREILNEKEKLKKKKMGRKVSDQLQDHKNGVIEKIIQEIDIKL